MKANLLTIVSCMVVSLLQPHTALALTDSRRLPISRSNLVQQITELPLSSPKQTELLLRAAYSHVLDTAYDLYTQQWRKHHDDLYTNLMRGEAAQLFWDDSMHLEIQKLYGLKSTRSDLFAVARDCLSKAVEIAPASATANMEDGYFLWQFGNQQTQGLALLKKSAMLAPNDPRVHATLGLVYSNQSGNAHFPEQAVSELKTAARLDPSYAYPHSILSEIYRWNGRNQEAQREHQIYESLLPRSPSS